MLICEDFEGAVFYPYHEVVALTPSFAGMVRAVTRQGAVVYTAAVPAHGPWVGQGSSWVLPDGLVDGTDPAGFLHPGLPEGIPGPAPEPVWLEKLGVFAHQVQGLRGQTWLTDQGELPGGHPSLHPDLVEVKRDLYVNRRRLRKLTSKGVFLDNGALFAQLPPYLAGQLAERLGASLQSRVPGMREYRLRDWPPRVV